MADAEALVAAPVVELAGDVVEPVEEPVEALVEEPVEEPRLLSSPTDTPVCLLPEARKICW